jgi:hypothetical protein
MRTADELAWNLMMIRKNLRGSPRGCDTEFPGI